MVYSGSESNFSFFPPYSLDLSSPNVAATVNAVLKPLETLSRIVNQPTGLGPGAQRGGSKNKTGSGGDLRMFLRTLARGK